MIKEELKYQKLYGNLPDDREDLLKYLENTHRINMDEVSELEREINQIPWNEVELCLPLVPKATPRPRWSRINKSFYVEGAQQNKKVISRYISNLGLICTRTEFTLEVYLPMPKSMSVTEMYLAEKGTILPVSKPDFDNLAKTYSDALIGALLIDDNIVNPGIIKKYYSIKPRVKIILRYQTQFDCKYHRKKVLNSKTYQRLSEGKNGSDL